MLIPRRNSCCVNKEPTPIACALVSKRIPELTQHRVTKDRSHGRFPPQRTAPTAMTLSTNDDARGAGSDLG